MTKYKYTVTRIKFIPGPESIICRPWAYDLMEQIALCNGLTLGTLDECVKELFPFHSLEYVRKNAIRFDPDNFCIYREEIQENET